MWASGPLFQLAESSEELLLAPAHHNRLARFGVVVVEQVQHTVHDEERDLVGGAHAALLRLAVRDRRAHHHITQEGRWVTRVGRGTRTASALVGLAARGR